MANRSDPMAQEIHGTNPQRIVEKILRMKVYATQYWKEYCFGLTAETLVDRAIEIDHVGGTYGGIRKPTKFMCLLLKMLQIQPDLEIIVEFIKNEEYKYVRALGALYLRCVGRPVEVYQYLEPLYVDYSKLRVRTFEGWTITHVDEFVDELLTSDYSCDIALPHLPKRWHLERQDLLGPRANNAEGLDDDDDDDDDDDGDGGDDDDDVHDDDDDADEDDGDDGARARVVARDGAGGARGANERVRRREDDDEEDEDARDDDALGDVGDGDGGGDGGGDGVRVARAREDDGAGRGRGVDVGDERGGGERGDERVGTTVRIGSGGRQGGECRLGTVIRGEHDLIHRSDRHDVVPERAVHQVTVGGGVRADGAVAQTDEGDDPACGRRGCVSDRLGDDD